jgi:hypothetical protein
MTRRLVSIATSRAVTPATAPVMAARVAKACAPKAPVWTKACVSPPANKPTIELCVLILCGRSLISAFLLMLSAYFTNERKPSDMRLPAAPRNHPPTQTTARPGMLPKTSATGGGAARRSPRAGGGDSEIGSRCSGQRSLATPQLASRNSACLLAMSRNGRMPRAVEGDHNTRLTLAVYPSNQGMFALAVGEEVARRSLRRRGDRRQAFAVDSSAGPPDQFELADVNLLRLKASRGTWPRAIRRTGHSDSPLRARAVACPSGREVLNKSFP